MPPKSTVTYRTKGTPRFACISWDTYRSWSLSIPGLGAVRMQLNYGVRERLVDLVYNADPNDTRAFLMVKVRWGSPYLWVTDFEVLKKASSVRAGIMVYLKKPHQAFPIADTQPRYIIVDKETPNAAAWIPPRLADRVQSLLELNQKRDGALEVRYTLGEDAYVRDIELPPRFTFMAGVLRQIQDNAWQVYVPGAKKPPCILPVDEFALKAFTQQYWTRPVSGQTVNYHPLLDTFSKWWAVALRPPQPELPSKPAPLLMSGQLIRRGPQTDEIFLKIPVILKANYSEARTAYWDVPFPLFLKNHPEYDGRTAMGKYVAFTLDAQQNLSRMYSRRPHSRVLQVKAGENSRRLLSFLQTRRAPAVDGLRFTLICKGGSFQSFRKNRSQRVSANGSSDDSTGTLMVSYQ